MTEAEMIEEYICSGCVSGPYPECHKPPGDYVGCLGHVLGTFMMGIGSLALGLPRGFNRPGPAHEPDPKGEHRNTMMIRCWTDPKKATWNGGSSIWNNLNVPVWAMVRDGALFVRTYMPRTNYTAIDVVAGGSLDMLPLAPIDVGEFYDEID